MDNLRPPCVNHSANWADDAVNTTAFGPAGPCSWGTATWNKAVASLKVPVEANAAPSFMGGIHVRAIALLPKAFGNFAHLHRHTKLRDAVL